MPRALARFKNSNHSLYGSLFKARALGKRLVAIVVVQFGTENIILKELLIFGYDFNKDGWSNVN
jgi:hypothetical protein